MEERREPVGGGAPLWGAAPAAVSPDEPGRPAAIVPAEVNARATLAARQDSPAAVMLGRLVRNPVGAIGGAMLLLLCLGAALAPVLAPFSPTAQHPGQELAIPAYPFLLGTDELGRDLLSRIIWGARVSLLVGVVAVLLGAAVGITSGLMAGYIGGRLDVLVMRSYDVIMAFPSILLGIAVVTVLGPGAFNVAIAIAVAQAPMFARLTRSIVLVERERDYVLAARAIGVAAPRIMRVHVLPNCWGPLLVQLSLAMGFSVMAESGLAFLGLGTLPPNPSWGSMLSDSLPYLRQAPWYGVWPGVALALLLISLNYFSDALGAALDPHQDMR